MGLPLFALGWSAVTVYNVLVLIGFALSGLAMAVARRALDRQLAGRRRRRAGLRLQRAHAGPLRPHAGAPRAVPAARPRCAPRSPRSARLAGGARLAVWCALQSLTSNYLLVMTALAMLVSAAAVPSAWIGGGTAPRRDGHRRRGLAAARCCCRSCCPTTSTPPAGARPPVRRRRALLGPVARLPRHRRPPPLRAVEPSRVRGATPLFPGFTVLGAGGRGAGGRRPGAGIAPAPWWRWRSPGSRVVRRGGTGLPLALRSRAPAAGHPRRRPARLAVAAGAGGAGGGRPGAPRTPLAGARHGAGHRRGLLVTVEAARTPMALHPLPASRRSTPTSRRCRRRRARRVPVPRSDGDPGQRSVRPRLDRALPPMLNGYSGFTPASYFLHAAVARRFPSADSLREFGYLGVTHIVVHVARIGHGPLDQLEATGLVPLLAREGDRPALRAGAGIAVSWRQQAAPGRGRRAGRAAHLATGA